MAKVRPLFEARAVASRPNATPVERANALMTEALIKPTGVDWKKVVAASRVAGADPKLVRDVTRLEKRQDFSRIYESYRKTYEKAPDKKAKGAARRDATAATYALIAKGKGISDPTDELYLAFVVLAFDGAVLAGDKTSAEKLKKDFIEVFPNRTRVIEDMKSKLEKIGSAG